MQRVIVSAGFLAFVTVLASVTLRAFGVPWWTCYLVAALPAALATRRLFRALPERLFARRAVFAIWTLVAAAALVQTARASLFMLDAERRGCSVAPSNEFYTHHSCYSAYYEAARLATQEPNIYDPELYGGRDIGPLSVDLYEYAPPFLVPFRLAVAAHVDFFALRGLWFAIDLGLVAAAVLLLAWHVGGRDGVRLGLLAPLVLFALPTQVTLQIGNFQLAALGLSVLALIAFEHDRPILGGALLSYVTLGKLFPGVFVLVLLFQRRWRPLLWTVGCAAVWLGLSFALLGSAPMRAFLSYQLPRIASGEAFPFLQDFPQAAAVNHSIYGIIIKLGHLGAPVGPRLAAAVSWLYTGVVIVAAWLVARQASGSRRQAEAWVALACVAALRSPFVPQEYALFGPIWLLSILALRLPIAVTAISWLVLNVLVPVDTPVSLRVLMLLTAIPQLLSFALVYVGLRDPEPLTAPLAQAAGQIARR